MATKDADLANYASDYRDDMLSLSPGKWIELAVIARIRQTKLAHEMALTAIELRVLSELQTNFATYDDLRAIGRGEGVTAR